MAKNNFGKFLLATAAIASACAGTYYYLTKKTEKQADTDFEAFDDQAPTESRSYVDLDMTEESAEATEAAPEEADFSEGIVAENVTATENIIGEADKELKTEDVASENGELEEFFDDEK